MPRHKNEKCCYEEVVEMFNCVLKEVNKIGELFMSAISDFAAKFQTFIDSTSSALDDIKTEIANLNDLITKLQNSPGTISAADQATLDALQTSGEELTKKAQALDTLTPPVPPTA